MYKALFDIELQEKMMDFFLNNLAKDGLLKQYRKNEIIDPDHADAIYVVVNGLCRQKMISSEGEEVTFFWLGKGTIFGEMDYFDEKRTCVITECLEPTIISVVSREIVEKRLKNNPEIYRFFLHSESRKYRLLMMSIVDSKFNNSLGQLSGFLYRLLILQNKEPVDNVPLSYVLTHQELANRIGCTRITLTKCINLLKEEGIIEYSGRSIVVKNYKKLLAYTKFAW